MFFKFTSGLLCILSYFVYNASKNTVKMSYIHKIYSRIIFFEKKLDKSIFFYTICPPIFFMNIFSFIKY